ncbi:octapeptide-repeat protein T2-like [Scleropages formosus]|uniref:octapeptide-repeat protein T2-like n=1 Tax=Scleropages formosus TaxID=113540 RepID=UPI0010FAAC17|nr:octapeptide-repeat protein T2-like [Scleropages formosus]XP_029114756.1 octapeptide-repeat protein T2-like [Scleropages formosus]
MPRRWEPGPPAQGTFRQSHPTELRSAPSHGTLRLKTGSDPGLLSPARGSLSSGTGTSSGVRQSARARARGRAGAGAGALLQSPGAGAATSFMRQSGQEEHPQLEERTRRDVCRCGHGRAGGRAGWGWERGGGGVGGWWGEREKRRTGAMRWALSRRDPERARATAGPERAEKKRSRDSGVRSAEMMSWSDGREKKEEREREREREGERERGGGGCGHGPLCRDPPRGAEMLTEESRGGKEEDRSSSTEEEEQEEEEEEEEKADDVPARRSSSIFCRSDATRKE